MVEAGLASGAAEIWTGEPEPRQVSPHRFALLAQFYARGLKPNPHLQARVQARILHFGRIESARFQPDLEPLSEKDSANVPSLLGSGFAMTEFLIAPVLGASSHRPLCSLGALANLMVVLCDRLLDRGESFEYVLPQTEFHRGASPVLKLLNNYRRQLEGLEPPESLRVLIEKLLARMIAAERRTVVMGYRLSYPDWLRKSAFPFVLMGLPAFCCAGRRQHTTGVTRVAYLRWLCKVGRLLGAIDDAADYEDDMSSGQANLFRSKSEQLSGQFYMRVADWCAEILQDWASLVGNSSKAVIFRETFLNFIWVWLQPSRVAIVPA